MGFRWLGESESIGPNQRSNCRKKVQDLVCHFVNWLLHHQGILGVINGHRNFVDSVVNYAPGGCLAPLGAETFFSHIPSQIARFMWPTWGPPGTGRTLVGPMLAPWTLLSRISRNWIYAKINIFISYVEHRSQIPLQFKSRVTLKVDVWTWKTIGHLFYATSSFVHHFVAIGEFKLELQYGNAQFGSNSTIFSALWPWDLTDDLEKQ